MLSGNLKIEPTDSNPLGINFAKHPSSKINFRILILRKLAISGCSLPRLPVRLDKHIWVLLGFAFDCFLPLSNTSDLSNNTIHDKGGRMHKRIKIADYCVHRMPLTTDQCSFSFSSWLSVLLCLFKLRKLFYYKKLRHGWRGEDCK